MTKEKEDQIRQRARAEGYEVTSKNFVKVSENMWFAFAGLSKYVLYNQKENSLRLMDEHMWIQLKQ